MAVYIGVSTVLALSIVLANSAVVRSNVIHDCTSNNDCAKDRVCVDQLCIDPCQNGVCGKNAVCHVTNHITKCACNNDYSGNSFSSSSEINCNNATADRSSKHSKTSKYHLYHSMKMNWYQSLAHCISINMRLATINSQEEQEELAKLIKDAHITVPGRWWIGASDLGQLGNYIWISSGIPLTYHQFAPTQPDNQPHAPTGVLEHCTEMRPEWDYKWNDLYCEYQQYHVCEEYMQKFG